MPREVLADRAQLPLDCVAEVSRLLRADPLELYSLRISEYHPRTFAAIEPRLDALTADEFVLVKELRGWVGSEYLAALIDEQRKKLTDWLAGMKSPGPQIALLRNPCRVRIARLVCRIRETSK